MKIFHYVSVARSLLRVPTYLLLIMYLCVGIFAGIAVTATKPGLTELQALLFKAAVCALIIALWYINGTALNDYADYEIDLINLKGDADRPLVVGTATKPDLLYAAGMCALASTALAFYLGWQSGVIVVSLLLLNISYSIKPFQISRRGGLAPLLLPLGYIVLPLVLGYLLHAKHNSALFSMLLASFYLQFMGRIILKDYRDVVGDKKHGKMTFLLRHGNRVVCAVSAACISASALLLVLHIGHQLHAFKFALISLTAFALVALYQLSEVDSWKLQKPVIAAFGRAMTGVTAAIITGLITSTWTVPAPTMTFMAVVLVVVYTWSAREAFNYNTQLQAKR